MNDVHFDPTISLGSLITVAVFVVTLLGLHKTNVERFVKMEEKVNLMWRAFQKKFDVRDFDGDREWREK